MFNMLVNIKRSMMILMIMMMTMMIMLIMMMTMMTMDLFSVVNTVCSGEKRYLVDEGGATQQINLSG